MTGRPAALRAASALLLAAATAACDDAASPAPEAGPLTFTAGEFTFLTAPAPHPMFVTLDGCLDADAERTVELVSVEPRGLTGAKQVTFRVAWPDEKHPVRTGGGPARRLPQAFAGIGSSSGTVRSCGDAARSTGMSLAVVLPVPGDTAVVVDGLTVEYRMGGKEFTAPVDAVLGSCAAHPADPAAEPVGCRA